jgi:hypothetical protein
MSEKRVFKSVDVAVYGRLDTNKVDLMTLLEWQRLRQVDLPMNKLVVVLSFTGGRHGRRETSSRLRNVRYLMR